MHRISVKRSHKHIRLSSKLVVALVSVLIAGALALVLYPRAEEVRFALQQPEGEPDWQVLVASGDTDAIEQNEQLRGNRVLFPSLGINNLLLVGTEQDTLSRGLWLKPNGSHPGENGNVIVTGHRFQWQAGAGPFYHLNKLKAGDEVSVKWDGQIYNYRIVSSEELTVDDSYIEGPYFGREVLTMYTCAGDNALGRHVITAERI